MIACFALHSAAVDPDELLRAFRRLSFRSALTAALATRMVPVLARDARRFRDAQRCRPGPPASRLALARAVTAGALDRAVDVAATLEVRGYGGSGRPARRVRPWSRHDLAFAVSAAALVALGAAAAAGRVGDVRGLPAAGGAGRRRRARPCCRALPRRPAPLRRPQGDRPMSELVLEHVTYAYPGAERPALADVSLRVEPGEFVVLAGGSGSGKSTLLRAAAGLVPHFHGGEFAGRLVAGGLDSREHGPAELSAVAGSLFQDPETQVVMGTVRAELAFPLENRGWGAAAVARGVEEAALALGVAGLLDRSTHELSGGELQRVALGAALAGRPRLLLLDEPTSQLDPVAGDELLGVLRRVNEEWGTAVVLAEHRLERCLAAADRVIALEDGAISIDADPRGFLEQAPPALQTPGARLFAAAGLTPPPVAVKDARAALRARGLGGTAEGPVPADPPPRRARLRRRPKAPVALAFDGVWLEIPRGPAVLRGVDLSLAPGERVALMGRNGAGKSTLLRLAAGLTQPTRGRIERGGRVSLLLQNPGDYLVAERVGEELPSEALAAAGLASLADRHPRDLSGGQRQRLALAIVLQGEPPAVVCLDEPTRGMDRGHKDALAAHLRELAAAGSAVLVATHDAEFAALWAERTVLLGDGAPVADAPTAEVLGGGWYFATQTARILGGCALLPEEGAALLRAAALGGQCCGLPAGREAAAERPRSPDELGRRLAARPRPRAGRRLRVVRADASHLAGARAGGDARRPRRARPDRVRAAAERQADHRHRAPHRLLARGRSRVRGRGGRGARQQRVLRPGAVDAVADVRVGRDRGRRRRARQGRRPAPQPDLPRDRLRARRRVLRRGDEPQHVGDVLRRSQPRQAGRVLRDVAAVRPGARRRERRVLPRLRPRARARAVPLPAAVRGQLAPGPGARRGHRSPR